MSLEFTIDQFFDYYVQEVDPNNNYKIVYGNEFQQYENDNNFDPFYTSVPLKKEFAELKTSANLDRDKFNQYRFKQQEFMSRFFNPRTPYNRMLVFHTVGTGKCVHPQTKIQTVNIGEKEISELWHENVADEIIDSEGGVWSKPRQEIFVWSFDPLTNSLKPNRVVNLYRQYVKEQLMVYTTSSLNTITCTKRHRLFEVATNSYTNDLKVGSIIKYYSSPNVAIQDTISSVNYIDYEGWVYDFEVENLHSYLANNFVTHNTCVAISVAETALKIDPTINKFIILVPSPPLKKNPLKDLGNPNSCVGDKYAVPMFDEKGSKYNIEERQRKLKQNVRQVYTIETYNEFSKQLAKMSDEQLIESYTNAYIFIDEAHNLKPSSKNPQKYNQILRLVHTVPSIKLMLLSATPMLDSHEDIVYILNLLNSSDNQIKLEDWRKWWQDRQFTKTDELIRKYLYGKVSYFRQASSNVRVLNQGKKLTGVASIYPDSDIGTKYLVATTNLVMDANQSAAYNAAWKADTESKQKSDEEADEVEDEFDIFDDRKQEGEKQSPSYKQSIAAGNFVFPSSSKKKSQNLYGAETEKGYLTKFVNRQVQVKTKDRDGNVVYKTEIKKQKKMDTDDLKASSSKTVDAELDDALMSKLKEGVTQKQSDDERYKTMINNLRKFSSKFAFVVEKVLEARENGEKVFIYTNIINGGGVALLGAILKLFDYEWLHVTQDEQKKASQTEAPRFVVLTSETATPDQLSDILGKDGLINDKKNRHGEYVQVILGTEVISEGVDLKHIRKVFILNPWWNTPQIDQAIGRAVRATSHVDLDPSERTVEIYRLATVPLDQSGKSEVKNNSIDLKMYATSEDKEKYIKQIERIMKMASIDCVLNKARNTPTEGERGSRECDFEECDWKCYGIPDILEKFDDNRWGVLEDTYNLYYGISDTVEIKKTIQQLFNNKSSYTFEEIREQLRVNGEVPNDIIIARTLSELIFKNERITNRSGFNNFLREENNLYFLVDDPAGTNKSTQAYYALNPIPTQIDNYYNVLISTFSEKLPLIMRSLQTTASDLKVTMDKMTKLPKYISAQIISEVEKIPPNERSGLEQTLAQLFLGAGKVEKDVDLFEYYGYSGNIPISQSSEENPKDFKIKAKVLYAKTAEGKEDKRLLAGQGTKCATGDYKMDRLYFILYKMAKLALSRTPTNVSPMQLIKADSKADYDVWSGNRRNNFNKIREMVLKDKAEELLFEYIISKKKPTEFFSDSVNVKQFNKIKDELASKDKKSFENLINEATEKNLLDSEILFVLEKIGLQYFEKLNTTISKKFNEEELEKQVKRDFKAIENEEGYSLEQEMKKLFGNDFSAKDLCGILRNWFKEVRLLEEK